MEKVPVDYTVMPHAIFSSPQVASVGFTEQQLSIKGINYQKSIYPYTKTGMGEAIEDRDGFVKFLVNRSDKKILDVILLELKNQRSFMKFWWQ
ncbi:MAG: hypothetical protein M3250_02655 [Thermoproteota archaeon]|nr:hypothetical protein [Thermoproteota archaeon]